MAVANAHYIVLTITIYHMMKTGKLNVTNPKFIENTWVDTLEELDEMFPTEEDKEQINWAASLYGLPSVWQETKGKGIKVAVLDTGVDPDHPDLADAITATKDFTGDGIEDENGHGTHCAGIIGARLNDIGFVGVAPECELLIGKVLANNGSGSYEWISEGIQWATEQGADIISMSLGGADSEPELFKAIHEALVQGKHVICAAGNEGSFYTNNIHYPGKYGAVLTIASHDSNGNPSGFSSRGGEVDFMGPGSNIWSTYKKGGYAELSGTSMATPFVAGISALILSKHKNTGDNETPIQNIEDLRNHLMRMAAHPGYHDNLRGYGALSLFK